MVNVLAPDLYFETLIGTSELSCLASARSLCETTIIIDACDRALQEPGKSKGGFTLRVIFTCVYALIFLVA